MQAAPATGPRPVATWLLAIAQALNLTCAVMMVTVGALAASELAPSETWVTLPYGAQFASVMLLTYPASMWMRRVGRRPVFMVAAFALMLAGATGFLALEQASFAMLTVAHLLVGAYVACANFYRFAAVDGLPAAARPSAMSLVIAGGVLAAWLGPVLAASLSGLQGFETYSPVYAGLAALGMANLLVLAFWRAAGGPEIRGPSASQAAPPPADTPDLSARPGIIGLAIFSAAGGYFVMNLLMVQSSLVMKSLCSLPQASAAIQAHVLAMFAPSLLTGWLIERLGLCKVLVLGFLLLLAASVCGLTVATYETIYAGLVLLGLGWNLTYVGGGALLSQRVGHAQRHRWQGVNDTVIAACATAGAGLPALLLSTWGWQGTHRVVLPFALGGAFLTVLLLNPPGRHANKAPSPP